MKSKYTKLKYTNTGVKAPVVTLIKSSTELSRSDMIELKYPEMILTIRRLLKKTMYNRAESLITVESDHFIDSFYVYDTINDARVMCENFYLIIKKPELEFRITTREYDVIYEYMKGVLCIAKES